MEAGGFAGDSFIRISLTWDNCNDLDMWLQEPGGGKKIFYSRKKNPDTGAVLDVDANAKGCKTETPVENIVYKNEKGAESKPPLTGEYKVTVNYYRTWKKDHPDSGYDLVIKLGNKSFAFLDKHLKARKEKHEYFFTYNGAKNVGCLEKDCKPVSLIK